MKLLKLFESLIVFVPLPIPGLMVGLLVWRTLSTIIWRKTNTIQLYTNKSLIIKKLLNLSSIILFCMTLSWSQSSATNYNEGFGSWKSPPYWTIGSGENRKGWVFIGPDGLSANLGKIRVMVTEKSTKIFLAKPQILVRFGQFLRNHNLDLCKTWCAVSVFWMRFFWIP